MKKRTPEELLAIAEQRLHRRHAVLLDLSRWLYRWNGTPESYERAKSQVIDAALYYAVAVERVIERMERTTRLPSLLDPKRRGGR